MTDCTDPTPEKPPPYLCPSCERAECLIWRRERRRLKHQRLMAKNIMFGMPSSYYTGATFHTEPNRRFRRE